MPSSAEPSGWEIVDQGWGRRAPEFATLSEPANVREYVAVHQALQVGSTDRVLDVACGSGLALELAELRGAAVSGIDASSRLVAVARDRCPDADIRVGDMHDLPWPDESFDVVTSFRGIWGTTPHALSEVIRVLRPGGRLGLTVWGHIKASPGAWALSAFRLASPEKVGHQADMVRLGRPGAGETLLAEYGFTDVRRITVPFVWEFADPDHVARALAATGPGFEAIHTVGEDAFLQHARSAASEHVRQGLPLRARIDVVGYLATKPSPDPVPLDEPSGSFLAPTPMTPAAHRLRQDDLDEVGYVMNVSRLWGRRPDDLDSLFGLLGSASRGAGLTQRQRGILVAACASAMGDAYCSLAWGGKLATAADDDVAAAVLNGTDAGLDDSERALAQWARKVATAPNDTTPADLESLRAAGYDDTGILALTLFVALRGAFSTVNDALGARPDRALVDGLPPVVRDAVRWGRAPED